MSEIITSTCGCGREYDVSTAVGMCPTCFSAADRVTRNRAMSKRSRRLDKGMTSDQMKEQDEHFRYIRSLSPEELAERRRRHKALSDKNKNERRRIHKGEFSRIPIHKPGERVCIDDDLEASLFRRGQSALAKCGLTRQDVALMVFNNRREWLYSKK